MFSILLLLLMAHCSTNEKTCDRSKEECSNENTHIHRYTREEQMNNAKENMDNAVFLGEENMDNVVLLGVEKIVTKEKENIEEELLADKKQKDIFKTHNLDTTQQIYFPLNDDGLARRNGVKVGHIQKVDIGHGKTVDVITRALKPLLFEIPNFLSDEECNHIIERAKDPKEGGMFTSRAKGGLTPPDTYTPTVGEKGQNVGPLGNFTNYDKNKDEIITLDEIISLVHAIKSVTLLQTDVKEMFGKLQSNVFADDKITEDEFTQLDTLGLEEYLDHLWRTNPRFIQRFSQQAWLFMEQWIDPTIHQIRERLVKISGLKRNIIYGGEMLQVVHYTPYGHYHAHRDSETHDMIYDIPCCHQYQGDVLHSIGKCKLCRYVTFMMYLNNVEEGGETAFPVADNESYDEESLRQHGNVSSDKYNLSHGCKRAQLAIKPKKGSAYLWYNHLVNETTGWMGELDLFSLHGGCDVIRGEKWLSNMWIPAPYAKHKQVPSIYLNVRDLELAEKQASS